MGSMTVEQLEAALAWLARNGWYPYWAKDGSGLGDGAGDDAGARQRAVARGASVIVKITEVLDATQKEMRNARAVIDQYLGVVAALEQIGFDTVGDDR